MWNTDVIEAIDRKLKFEQRKFCFTFYFKRVGKKHIKEYPIDTGKGFDKMSRILFNVKPLNSANLFVSRYRVTFIICERRTERSVEVYKFGQTPSPPYTPWQIGGETYVGEFDFVTKSKVSKSRITCGKIKKPNILIPA